MERAHALQKRIDAVLEEIAKVVGGDVKDYIDDFIASDAPQFKGKSKAKRIEMALGAYYGS